MVAETVGQLRVGDEIRVEPQGGDRRAQPVPEVGDVLPLVRDELLDPVGEEVERSGQLDGLVGALGSARACRSPARNRWATSARWATGVLTRPPRVRAMRTASTMRRIPRPMIVAQACGTPESSSPGSTTVVTTEVPADVVTGTTIRTPVVVCWVKAVWVSRARRTAGTDAAEVASVP